MSSPPLRAFRLGAGSCASGRLLEKAGSRWPGGSGPESAGGSLRGAWTCRPGHPVAARWSAASESAVVPSTMLGSRSRNAWPARPRPVAARPILGPAPLRAFHRVPSDVRVRADLIATGLATDRAAVLMIEIDSISQIGPTGRRVAGGPGFQFVFRHR